MTTPEGKIKKEIRDWLTSIGAYHFAPVQTGYGTRTLDILCCIKGKFVAIEVKRPGINKPGKFQAFVTRQIHAAGGIAFTTNDVERAKDYIRQHVLNEYQPRSEI